MLKNICELMHPDYLFALDDWQKWRYCWQGGTDFVKKYLKRYSVKERDSDYLLRIELTPPNLFATTQILDITNAIYDRMPEINRQSTSVTYNNACAGKNGGVDKNNSTMNYFIGMNVLQELGFMGSVGVYVDAPQYNPSNLIESIEFQPYLYIYTVEQIQCWKYGDDGKYDALLLVDYYDEIDENFNLVTGLTKSYRYYKRNYDGTITLQIFDSQGMSKEIQIIDIPEIPFVLFKLPHSLMSKVCDHQIALMNIESSDLFFVLKGNFPLFVEQYDPASDMVNQLKKLAVNPNNTDEGSQAKSVGNQDNEIHVGMSTGRKYGKDLEYPTYIAPPTDTVKVSMEKQEQIKRDIVILLNKSVAALKANRTSAESKDKEVTHEEQGLNYIGLELNRGEIEIARFWLMYENNKSDFDIQYPTIYKLKTDQDRLSEAKSYTELIYATQTPTYRREIAKRVVRTLFHQKVTPDVLVKMYNEIDKNPPPIAMDSKSLEAYIQNTIMSPELASTYLGFPEGEAERAAEAHAQRAKRIAQAQAEVGGKSTSNDPNNDSLTQDQRDSSNSDDLVKQGQKDKSTNF